MSTLELEQLRALSPIAIRPWIIEDARALDAAIADSLDHLRPWMPWVASEPRSLIDREAMIQRWETERRAGGDLVFGIFRGVAVVGGCGLHHRIGRRGLEIGYWVAAAHTRCGYATTAAAMLTSIAFTYPAIDLVEIRVDAANYASAGVPRKLGYTRAEQVPVPQQAPAETGVRDVWRVHRAEWLR